VNEANRENSGEGIQAERALKFVQTLLAHMDLDADATISPDAGEDEDDREVRIEIEGVDAGRVIGKRGVVLEAIQYLTTRVAHRPGEDRLPICVDAEGYRARHEEQLAAMAAKLAERVAAEGKIVTFDPMNPRDRRVVHMAVRDIVGVRTESNGNGHDRRVQIIPDRTKTAATIAAAPREERSRDERPARTERQDRPRDDRPARAAAPAAAPAPARAPKPAAKPAKIEAAPVAEAPVAEAPKAAKPRVAKEAKEPKAAAPAPAPVEAAKAPAKPKAAPKAKAPVAEAPVAEVVAEAAPKARRAPKKAD
jgi:spoIIIJ-associated protein